MPLTLDKADQQAALASLQRYLNDQLDEPVGNVMVMGLLGFITQELGPLFYNRGVADAQERLAARVSELDIEVHEDPFSYWKRQPAR